MNLHRTCKPVTALGPVAIGANGTKPGVVIDRRGFYGVEFVASYGEVTTTGTVATLVIKEGDTSGALTSVADLYLLGTELMASLPAAASRANSNLSYGNRVDKNVSRRIGYTGAKRYVSASIVSSGATSAGCVSVVALLHNPALGAAPAP